VSLGSFGYPLYPLHQKKNPTKNKGVGLVLFLTHCPSHLLFLVHLLAVWFPYKSAVMMLLIVPVRVQDSPCMGLGLVSWDISILSAAGLLVVLLVVVWPFVSDMPIYDGFLAVMWKRKQKIFGGSRNGSGSAKKYAASASGLFQS
jgi:hypothetical protein